MTPSGIAGASRAKSDRSMARVARSRALTPTTVAPVSSARASSASVCTSTSGTIPIDCARSTSDTRAFCSSAATMSSTMRPGLPELIGADDEVLAEHGHLHGRADCGEVLAAAAEPPGLGQHADHAGTACLVVHRQGGRVGDRGDRALGRARPLHLGDDGDILALQQRDRVPRGWRPAGSLLEAVQRDVTLPCRQVGTHSVENLVEYAHAVMPPLGWDALRPPMVARRATGGRTPPG